MNKIKILISFLLVIIIFNSCEAFLKYSGNVYNSQNEPLQNARVSLIIGKRDTVKRMGEILDTISVENRMKLRKSGIKDDLKYNSNGQIYEPTILYTDKNGFFKTRTVLFGCGFKCPDVKILVEKDNQKKVLAIERFTKRDSLQIKME